MKLRIKIFIITFEIIFSSLGNTLSAESQSKLASNNESETLSSIIQNIQKPRSELTPQELEEREKVKQYTNNGMDGLTKQIQDVHLKALKDFGGAYLSLGRSSFGLFTNLLGQSVDHLKDAVDSGTNMARNTVHNMQNRSAKSFSTMNKQVDKSTDAVLGKLQNYIKMMDMYKNALSGISKTKKPDAKGHRITIVTNSDAPIKAFNNFVNDVLPPSAASSDKLPEIEDIDFSNFF